jgi:hypothetical protein
VTIGVDIGGVFGTVIVGGIMVVLVGDVTVVVISVSICGVIVMVGSCIGSDIGE